MALEAGGCFGMEAMLDDGRLSGPHSRTGAAGPADTEAEEAELVAVVPAELVRLLVAGL